MKRTKPTLERHKEIGEELKRIELYCIDLTIELSRSYNANSYTKKYIHKVIDNLSNLKSALDDEVYRENPDTSSKELSNIYYGGL